MKPVLKWVGGKRQLLKEINKLKPKSFNKYFEPFVGGGAVLYELKPKIAIINDLNKELYNTYNVIKDYNKLELLMSELDKHELTHNEEYYYKIRSLDRESEYSELKDYQKAARTIYLNKAGFNGLYRVNSKGQFNVPSGKKEKVNTYSKENMLAINRYFRESDIKILNDDFSKAVKGASKHDFVYFDPPYDKVKEDTFTSYHKNDFGREDQIRLFELYRELDKKGVYVMLSNHNTKFIRDLYKEYNINIVQAKRMINSDASKRGKVEEVIITNYEVE